MPYAQTPNYKFNLPVPTDTMADPANQIDNTWIKVNSAANPTIITAVGGVAVLPTTGYKVGDRIYVEDPGFDSINSSFLCITDDVAPWGNWWLPVQDQSAPWRSVPAGAFGPGNLYQQNPADNWQITITNRSQLFMRGSIRHTTGQIPNDVDELVCLLPAGLRPASATYYMGTIEPTNFNASGGSFDQFRAARINVEPAGPFITVRGHGATAAPLTNLVYMSQVRYPLGTFDFTNP